MQDAALVEDVSAALKASKFPPQRLVLEVTESQLVGDDMRAVAVLEQVRELGVLIAVDDFGTGYSSLSQLERLPVDVLKVAREFTGCGGSDRARLLDAVREIGNSLGLYTIAEGIETSEQLRQLRSLRYALGQGYLFSRPVPGDAVLSLLSASPLPHDDDVTVREPLSAMLENARLIRERSRQARVRASRARREIRVGRAARGAS